GSYLCVPIVYQDKFLGRLNASFNSPHKFTDDEIKLIQTIAHHLAFVIVHKEAEERILHSERNFRTLFENAVVGIYRSTPDGRFLMANETLARINGYESVEELMKLDIPTQIYLNPEDRERFKKLMVERGYVSDYRYPIKRKDGSIGWVTKWARAVKDENGEVLYYEGFVLDITEQVQLEQRLKALQETARSLVMRLDIGSIVQIAVSEMSTLFPNSAVLVFRYQEETDSFTLEGANEDAKDLLRVLRLNVGSTFKRRGFSILENRLWSGEGFLVSDLSDTVGSSLQELVNLGYKSIFVRGIGDSSQLWGMIAICRKGANFAQQDIDFVNSFCDYLSIAIRNASLFQQVQQAYEELRAIQERIMEQERLRALGQIASGIAHDINNALVPIQGFAEILMEHGDPMVRDAAEVIFKSANDITATVQRMREFYKVRTSEEVLEMVDLNSICKDAWVMTRPRWFNMPRERGIVIETRLELADDLPPLMGIPGEIRQAIVNLVINAVDAMPEGGVLTIRTYRRDKGGREWAVIEVSDTGVGMDEETKRRAIEPFFTTKGERGSGLGLPAVYGTVQRHEGFMEIDSELGKGTTVRLWFPSNVVKTVELPEGELPSLRLLVIDDEPSVRETLALLLRKDGHVVSTAVDGEEGLELFQIARLQGRPFNVVITDLGMPKMDGMTVARKIKEIAPETPVVLLSGWGFRIRSEEVKEVIDIVLTKPATHQQIRRALSQVWNKRMALSN
ncbi:MAG: response regulator, partial [Armatimonadetes bacterium]|nr:response regulator [Armatimonadota bacterium]